MNKLFALIRTDLSQVFRDKTLLVFLFTPFLLLLFARYAVPALGEKFPFIVEYQYLAVLFAAVQTSIIFGFITGFIMLDEKDENVFMVLRTLPIKATTFIFFRLVFATLFSMVGAFVILLFCGFAYPGFFNAVLLSVQYGLAAPIITLILATYANNKIEGMAIFKGIDLVLILPIAAFFITGIYKYIFYIFPTFWTYKYFIESLQNGGQFTTYAIGIVIYILLIVVLFVQFRKKVFER